MTVEIASANKSFGGWHKQIRHYSNTLNCSMRFAIYLPPKATSGEPVPVLYWLSGLTCNDENFMQKAGAQRLAAELNIAIVAPDTSPRGDDIPDDPEGADDFGLAAGFYVNATEAPWNTHYQMYDYITRELPALVEAEFPVTSEKSICGHSMGGHGALMIALKNPDAYRSVSAFAPIVNPTEVPWGQKAFRGYLGDNLEAWKEYDSCELMRKAEKFLPMLVDQGDRDPMLEKQLKPERFVATAEEKGYPLEFRMQPGYDHGYYFIASFIDDHLKFHAKYLVK